MAAKLKVFVTSDGLTDYVVATTSRAKALAAWGVHQDIFKQGAAREVDDPALVKAASARPGEVLERKVGSSAALKAIKAAPAKTKAGPSKAALKTVADLEKRLAALEDRWAEQAAAIEEAREVLDRREEREQAEHEAQRARLSEQLKKAKEAF